MVTSLLLNAVLKEIVENIFYLNSTQAIWDDLAARFQQQNTLRIFQLKQKLQNLSQGTLDVNGY